MNLDGLTDVWRSQDLSPLYRVDKTALHQMLQQEQVTLEKQARRSRLFMYAVTALLFTMSALFLAIMIDPNDDDVLSVWDYAVGGMGVAASIVLGFALRAMRRLRTGREQGFGDSLRDHLRRRIAELDDEATGEHRLVVIIVVTTLICASAVSIASFRINDVPWGEFDWWSFQTVAIVAFYYFMLFRWLPAERRRKAPRKRQLETLLTELDGQ